MKMNAWDLYEAMGNVMEANVRKILIKEKLAKVEEVAIMNRIDICAKLLEFYEIVSCDEDEIITLVKRDKLDIYKSIINVLSNQESEE